MCALDATTDGERGGRSDRGADAGTCCRTAGVGPGNALAEVERCRVPDALHVEIKVAAAQRHATVQALVIAALEAWLSAPPPVASARPGDAYRPGSDYGVRSAGPS